MELLTSAQTAAYLRRIGYCGSAAPTLAVLDALILAHQCAVPFEGLDLSELGRPIRLEQEALFEKIVKKRRGGYCFELNGLFCTLLQTLGFAARPSLGRVVAGSDDLTAPIRHRCTLVTLDGADYFCDVGFGGGMPSRALRLGSEDWQDAGGTDYRIEDRKNGWLALCRRTEEGSRIELLFTPIACYDSDFLLQNEKFSTDPKSRFRRYRTVNLRTPDGFRNIRDGVYRESVNGTVTEREIGGGLTDLLREKFGIVLE